MFRLRLAKLLIVNIITLALLLAPTFVITTKVYAESQPANIDDQVRQIAKDLKCLVCENESVADSPSPLAADMRETIKEKLLAGETPEQIKAYFVQQYGEQILLTPPKEGFGLLVWSWPILAIIICGIALFFAMNKWVRRKSISTTESSNHLSDTEIEDAEILQEIKDRRVSELW